MGTTLALCLVQGSDRKLWLGSATKGVFRIDWQTGKVANFRHREGDSLSITIDEIWDMAELHREAWSGSTIAPRNGNLFSLVGDPA